MIVATGTAHAQTQKHLARDVRDVVENIGPLPAHVALVVFVGAQPEIAGRDPQLGIVGIQLISGKLLAQEAVVGLVGIEATDDIVAISPGVGANGILAISVGFGIANEVEPVSPPCSPYRRRSQQAVDQPLVGIRVIGPPRTRRFPRLSAAAPSGRRSRGGSGSPCRLLEQA